MDVDAEVEKWHQALVGLFLAHTKEQMDRWDYRLDDLMTVILAAPVAQLRQFAKGLLEVMKNDERAPLFLWSPRRARLTTDHCMSSYGQPVVVVKGQAYDTGGVLWLDGSPEAMEKAAEAGFSTLPSEYSQWPEYYDALPA